jgi:hypothetical protein
MMPRLDHRTGSYRRERSTALQIMVIMFCLGFGFAWALDQVYELNPTHQHEGTNE